jgi:hypothetical protein
MQECYSQRKLVEIDSYLMHAGKPWRKGGRSHEVNEGDIILYASKLIGPSLSYCTFDK